MSLNQAQQIYINQSMVRPTSVGNSGSSGLVGVSKKADKKALM
jgi:hypothetical protein